MNGDPVKAALEALGQVLGITASVKKGVLKAALVPDLSTVDLKNFSANGLSVPMVAPLRLSGVGKNVGFPTGRIVDGDPAEPATRLVADPLPDSADLSSPATVVESPLQAVLGLVAGVEGTVPVGLFTPDFVTVTATICWRVQPDRDCAGLLPLGPGESFGDEEGCTAVTTDPKLELPVPPPLVPLRTRSTVETCTFHLTAEVTLRALGAEHTQVVGPVDVAVPAIAVPTVLVVFSEMQYNTGKDGGRLVIVPSDVPVQSIQSLVDTLQALNSALAPLTGFVRIVGLLTGLNSLLNALRPVPAGSKHKLLFASLDETRDLGKVAPDWRHRPVIDDHGAEDDIASLLMVSVDQRVELFEHQKFKGPKIDARPSETQLWLGVPDFHDMTGFVPPDASVASDRTNFNDRAHSLRFAPR